MWKAATNVTAPPPVEADDWETDPDFVNDVSEQEQRWGPAGRNVEAIDMAKLREEVFENDRVAKQKQYEEGPKSSYGYGGKFGVQKDRMDKSAVGHEYVGKVEKHVSQTDYAKGFGGSFGVQTDRVDKSAAGWEHKEQVEKHSSQKDYSVGFGGKFGVQLDRKDASAVGWDHREETQQHNSQKDYTIGFGGKFGIQTDRQDASAVGWDHQEKTLAHASQTDHKKGFGGKFGVETDRVDKSAHGFEDMGKVGTAPKMPDVKEKPTMKVSSMRARFEKISDEKNEEAQKTVQMIRQQREVTDKELSAKEKQKNNETPEQPKATTPIVEKTEPLVQAQVKRELDPVIQVKSPVEVKSIIPEVQIKSQPVHTPEEVTAVSPKLERPQAQSPEPPITETQRIINQPLVTESDTPKPTPTVVVSPVGWDTESSETDEDDSGYTARALYDYQAAAPDEISFDPDDIITNIVMVDEGWWQGLCKGAFGLFPANYVQLH